MKSIFRSARKPGPSAAGGGGRRKRRAPSSSDESDSNSDESLLPARKQKWRKRSSSVERNSESSSSGGKFAERHADDADVDDAGDCTEIRKTCGGRLKKRAAPSSSDSSDDDDPLPPTQKRSSLVQQTSFRRSRRSLGDRKFAALEARRRYVKDRADSTRRQSKLKPAESEAATSRPGASSIELVAGEEHDSAVQWKTLISETPPRPCGSAVEDVARTPSTSNPLHGRHCISCHGPLVAIGTDRKNGKTYHSDWPQRKYHKKCWIALQKPRNGYGFSRMHMRMQVNSSSDMCPNCGNPCSVKTSSTRKNPMRQYYACACKATPGSGFRESFVKWLE